MNPQEIVSELIKRNINIDYQIAEGHINNEQSVTNDYRGRAIYEFFQNAIDRAERKIWIKLDKDAKTLIIANDGHAFSIQERISGEKLSDFHSLCSINTSSKKAGESIGNKGVGFKSCWEYTKKVSIASILPECNTKWGFRLHNPLTNDIIESWKESDDQESSLEFIKKMPRKAAPSFYFPEYYKATDTFENFPEAKTILQFHDLSPEKINDLEEKIKEFSRHYIFFVTLLDGLKNKNVELVLEIIGHNGAPFKKSISTQVSKDNWLIERADLKSMSEELKAAAKDINYEVEVPTLAIAFPLKKQIIDSKFYCYLPTEVNCGFNVLIHADFLLDRSRKQIDFKNTKYNKLLLEQAAKLMVRTLKECGGLHSIHQFAHFLIPINSYEDKAQTIEEPIDITFKQLLWAELTKANALSSILKKVFPRGKKYDERSYSLVFSTIKHWINHQPARQSGEWYDTHYNKLYQRVIHHFCSPDIRIVPIKSGCDYAENDREIESISFLPQKNDKDNAQKLIYRNKTKEQQNSTLNFELLEDVQNISLTQWPEINADYFTKLNIVKPFSTIEVIRALAIESESSRITDENSRNYCMILRFVKELVFESKNFNPEKSNIHCRFLTEKDSDEKQLSRIFLPCKDGNWYPAKLCCFEDSMDEEITKSFSNVHIVDLNKVCEILQGTPEKLRNFIAYMGCWSTIPLIIHEKKFSQAWDHIPQTAEMPEALAKAHVIWDQCIDNRKGLSRVYGELKKTAWFPVNEKYNSSKEEFVKPCQVFLVAKGHRTKLEFLIKEPIPHDAPQKSLLFDILGIKKVEETTSAEKLLFQLKRLKDYYCESTIVSHYKALINQLSTIDTFSEFDELPLLAESKGTHSFIDSKENQLWFASRPHRRDKKLFKELSFITFDEDTPQKFVNKIKRIKFFKPEYKICPHNSLSLDHTLKTNIETNGYLRDFFTLAAHIRLVGGGKYDFDLSLKRWQFHFKIQKAHDVWLEVKIGGKTEYIGKESPDDVLFIPERDRQNNLESVGQVAHDLKGIDDRGFIKFGSILADAIFRNAGLGPYFANYILLRSLNHQEEHKDKMLDDWFSELGISRSDRDESQLGLQQNLMKRERKKLLVEKINTTLGANINQDNWHQLKEYSRVDKSFIELEKAFAQDSDLLSAIAAINPKKLNIQRTNIFRSQHLKQLKIAYLIEKEAFLSEGDLNKISNLEMDLKGHNGESYAQQLSKFSFCPESFITERLGIEKLDDYKEDQSWLNAQIRLEAKIDQVDMNLLNSLTRADQSTPKLNAKGFPLTNGDKEPKVVKVIDQKSREQHNIEKAKRGLGLEKIVAINAAKDILDISDNTIQDKIWLLIQKEYEARQLGETPKSMPEEIYALSQWLNPAGRIGEKGDGLGYDVLVFDENNEKLNRVEVKSSISGHQLYLSEAERQRVLYYAGELSENDNFAWKLWLFVSKDGQYIPFDVTEEVQKIVDEHYTRNNGDQKLIADSWRIDFNLS